MPSVNLYVSADQVETVAEALPDLRALIAHELSGGSRKLDPAEVSVRVQVPAVRTGMIADLEFEIAAHAYPERVLRQDAICLRIRAMLLTRCPGVGSVFGWLQLSELGHSA